MLPSFPLVHGSIENWNQIWFEREKKTYELGLRRLTLLSNTRVRGFGEYLLPLGEELFVQVCATTSSKKNTD